MTAPPPGAALAGGGARTLLSRLAATGGMLAAIGAASCCILPLALFSMGAGRAWIGSLVSLSPYQPIFVAVSLGFVAGGFWLARRRGKVACALPLSSRITRIALWSAAILVAAAAAFPYAAPVLLGS